MNTVAMYIGYGIMAIAALALVVVILVNICNFAYREGKYFYVTTFGFGILRVNNSNKMLMERIVKCRKDLNAGRQGKNARYYFLAPTWFNKHVWNFGVRS